MYCDYAATTPLSTEMKDYLYEVMDKFGNPSSHYSLGDETRSIVENTRLAVRNFINVPENMEVVFTSSGSASNSLAVEGFFDNSFYRDKYLLCFSPLVHKSLEKVAEMEDESDRCLLTWFRVSDTGVIDLSDFDLVCKSHKRMDYRPFVVVEYANSEIGTIQPIKEIAEIVHKYHGIIYVDCTGAISSLPINMKDLDVDMLGFSAHKLGALKGCGVLCYRRDLELIPSVFGSQENGLFAGTENVLGIASLGYAIENHSYNRFSNDERTAILNKIKENGWKLAGEEQNRLPNSFYFCVPGRKKAEWIIHDLDAYYDIQASTGSACSSGSERPSNALKALYVPDEDIFNYIRLSFSGLESLDEVIGVLDKIKEIADAKV